VQTLEGTPTVVHCGPFANVSIGTNSILATRFALSKSNYTIVEAGFGADLGGEKFINVVTPIIGKNPGIAVIVATTKALKLHGGVALENINEENLVALELGYQNLQHHIKNLQKHNLPVIVAINQFPGDTDDEILTLRELLHNDGIRSALVTSFVDGGMGSLELATKVQQMLNDEEYINHKELLRTYDKEDDVRTKLSKVVQNIYGANDFTITSEAETKLTNIEEAGYKYFPICVAKTPNSLSGDGALLNVPTNFDINVTDVELRAGAGFVMFKVGSIMTLPGQPKVPSALNISFTDDGEIFGIL